MTNDLNGSKFRIMASWDPFIAEYSSYFKNPFKASNLQLEA